MPVKNLVNKHNKLYWKENSPTISDEAFDYISNLSNEEETIQELKLNKDKIVHSEKMLSLNKVYNKEDLYKWCKSVSRTESEIFIIQPKYDGIASKILKKHKKIVTRGDGIQGEDITFYSDILKYEYNNQIIYSFDNILNSIQSDHLGELIVKKSDFENNKSKIFRNEGTEYKTPRNMCGGILSKDIIDPNSKFVPTFVSYDLMCIEFTLINFDTVNFDEIISQVKSFDYPSDGLVIKLKDIEYSKSLGCTSHHPRGQIAFKFTNPVSKSILENIEWSYGKSVITPVAIIKPVMISGITITRTSLHNYKFLIDNDIQIGDEIIIERAGDIIPHFVDTLTKGENRYSNVPEICEYCNSKIIYEEPNLKCSNENCNGSLHKIIHDSITKLGIENIGPETVIKMIDVLNISSIIDILDLTKEDILKLDGFKEKSSSNIINEISRVRSTPIEDWKILAALNIKGIGRTVSKDILSNRTLSELLIKYDDLLSIKKIGPERVKDITQFINTKLDFINLFISKFEKIIDTKQSNNKQSTNIEICFTGKGQENRDYYHNIAKNLGLIPGDDIKTNTKILVTNDINSNSGKMKKAIKKGIKIITYEKFMELKR